VTKIAIIFFRHKKYGVLSQKRAFRHKKGLFVANVSMPVAHVVLLHRQTETKR
jgi:hypothetical protein